MTRRMDELRKSWAGCFDGQQQHPRIQGHRGAIQEAIYEEGREGEARWVRSSEVPNSREVEEQRHRWASNCKRCHQTQTMFWGVDDMEMEMEMEM